MIVKWTPLSPTTFEGSFRGFDMVIDQDMDGNWPVYVYIGNRGSCKLKRSGIVGTTANDAKTKVDVICERILGKMRTNQDGTAKTTTVLVVNAAPVKKAPARKARAKKVVDANA